MPESHSLTLDIDLGPVGYRADKAHPFAVRLSSTPLRVLVSDARRAHRVYELLLIERPGDVWDYVDVTPLDVAPRVAERIVEVRRDEALFGCCQTASMAASTILFRDFDRLFFDDGDDTTPEDAAWLREREALVLPRYARQLFALVQDAKAQLGWNDALVSHVSSLTRQRAHPYDTLSRADAIAAGRTGVPDKAHHSEAFYRQLAQLLQDPAITSVAYRSQGDYEVLRHLATEQRRRADLTGHAPQHALAVRTLSDLRIDPRSWDAQIEFFSEGLGHGDLFIEGGGIGTAGTVNLIEDGHYRPTALLALKDLGNLAGFDKETGDGWACYRHQAARSRRTNLTEEFWRDRSRAPVLCFDDHAWLHAFEKVLIIVGKGTPPAAHELLAQAITEAASFEFAPPVLVEGDASAFHRYACKNIVALPKTHAEGSGDDAASLTALIAQRLPWIDAILALHAPAWAKPVLARCATGQPGPWLPWVVSTPESGELTADIVLHGDLGVRLENALKHARALRF